MIERNRRLLNFLLGGAAAVIITAGLRAAAELLSPVLLAAFLAVLVQPVTRRLRKTRVGGAAIALVVLAVILIGLALVGFVGVSLRQIAGEIPAYRDKLQNLSNSTVELLARRGVDAPAYIDSAIKDANLGRIALNITGAVAGAFANGVLTLLIFVFMLGGFWEMERRAATGARDHSPVAARFLRFSDSLRGYMKVRAVLGIVAAVANYLVLIGFGVQHALLWAVLSFFLSFVPNIGFALALIPPVLLALLDYGWLRALGVFIGYEIINLVVDQIVGPRMVGKQLEISALLSLLSVIFWGWVLGPIGAILSVPITVLVRDLAFGETNAPDLGPPQAVTDNIV